MPETVPRRDPRSVPPLGTESSPARTHRADPGGATASVTLTAVGQSAGPSNRGIRVAAIITATIAVLAGAAAIVLSTVTTGPPPSPEDAAQRLFDRLQARDGLGVLAALAPTDREAIRQPVLDGVSQLQRLGLLTNVDPANVGGVSVSTDSLRFQRSTYPAGLAAVDVVAGRMDMRLEGDAGLVTAKGRELSQKTFRLDAEGGTFTRDFAQYPLRLVTVNTDGGWYVSVPYSVAEAVRPRAPTAAGAGSTSTAGTAGTAGTTGTGFSSPEEAVRQFATALADGDRTRAAGAAVPAESGLIEAAGFLFPIVDKSLPDPNRTGSVQQLDLAVEGTGPVRKVKVTRLDAGFGTDVNQTEISYDSRCFEATYRFIGATDPYARYRTCNGEKTAVTIARDGDGSETSGTTETETSSSEVEGEVEGERSSAATTPPRDSFGQPIEPEGAENRALTYRPLSDPFSALAVFGGGADLPAFTVVQQGSAWYVSPMRTALDATVDTLRATKPDQVEALLERLKQHTETAQNEAVVFEARDPDNALFGSATVKSIPMLPLCYIEVRATAGGKAALALYNECVARLVQAGRLDVASVPPSQLFIECVTAEPTSPPALDNPLRRAYFADKASRECFQQKLATAGGKVNVFDKVSPPDAELPCFGPYGALDRTAPESDWAAADAQVASCYGR